MASHTAVNAILWEYEHCSPLAEPLLNRHKKDPKHRLLIQTQHQLTEYFQGHRKKFEIPLAPLGSTFQIRAWQALCTIPYGQTISYGEQAKMLGDKNKARAVGMANGLNPLPILIPCHRVIGANKRLTGFGGGLENKALLLALENSDWATPSK